MNTITIKDTHATIAMLQEKGASKELAEGIVETLQSAKLESDPATKNDISDLKTEIKATENRLLMWMVGLVLALGGFLFATLG